MAFGYYSTAQAKVKKQGHSMRHISIFMLSNPSFWTIKVHFMHCNKNIPAHPLCRDIVNFYCAADDDELALAALCVSPAALEELSEAGADSAPPAVGMPVGASCAKYSSSVKPLSLIFFA